MNPFFNNRFVISTAASPSGTEGEAEWRDLLFAVPALKIIR